MLLLGWLLRVHLLHMCWYFFCICHSKDPGQDGPGQQPQTIKGAPFHQFPIKPLIQEWIGDLDGDKFVPNS
jgi:hypothetical protein